MKIICLIGPSGSGKTTIGEMLKCKGIPEIVSHTTRPPRVGETNGVTYNFVSDAEFDKLQKVEEVVYAGNRYCTSKEEIEKKMKTSNILFCIVTKDGCDALKSVYKDSVISVFIDTDMNLCIDRMNIRGDTVENIQKRVKNFEEMKEFNNSGKCDYVLTNKSNLEALNQNVIKLLNEIQTEG